MTQIPEQGVRFCHDGQHPRGAVVPVAVRAVGRDRADGSGRGCGADYPGETERSGCPGGRSGRATLAPGGLRIELVKTGALHNGRLTRLQDEVEYRLLERRHGRQHVVLRESLKLASVLDVRVVPSVVPSPDEGAQA